MCRGEGRPDTSTHARRAASNKGHGLDFPLLARQTGQSRGGSADSPVDKPHTGFWTVYTHTTQHFEMVLHVLHRSLYSPLRGFVQNEAFQRVGLLHPRRAGKNLLRVLVTGPRACPNARRTEVDVLGMVFSIESWRQQTHDVHPRQAAI